MRLTTRWWLDDEAVEDVVTGEAELGGEADYEVAIDGGWPCDEEGTWSGPYQAEVADEIASHPAEGPGLYGPGGWSGGEVPDLDEEECAAYDRWLCRSAVGA